MVAPVVSTPPHAAGSANRSLSQVIAISSRRVPSGDDSHANAFWSYVEVSQSAASAAGVPPPTTQ